jgi:hypothetical protein
VDHTSITAADFVFKVGNDNTPGGWAAAAAPSAVSVRTGAGVSGSDRVEITWADNAIQKQWLEVQVLANANTGLADNVGGGIGDVFFWGNAIGDTKLGNTATGVTVGPSDEIGVRANPHSAFSPALVDDDFDVDKDKLVNPVDELIIRANPLGGFTPVRLILIPTGGPFAPEGDGDGGGDGGGGVPITSSGDAGISSGLASSSSSEERKALPVSISARLETVSSGTARLADVDPLLEAAVFDVDDSEDANVDDEPGLDDELLDSLVAGLALK